jgi:hypothetical protein
MQNGPAISFVLALAVALGVGWQDAEARPKKPVTKNSCQCQCRSDEKVAAPFGPSDIAITRTGSLSRQQGYALPSATVHALSTGSMTERQPSVTISLEMLLDAHLSAWSHDERQLILIARKAYGVEEIAVRGFLSAHQSRAGPRYAERPMPEINVPSRRSSRGYETERAGREAFSIE